MMKKSVCDFQGAWKCMRFAQMLDEQEEDMTRNESIWEWKLESPAAAGIEQDSYLLIAMPFPFRAPW